MLSWAKPHRSPAALAETLCDWWITTRHLAFISDLIIKTIFDPTAPKRLMVLVPPRHGKSTLISQYLPAWYLDLFPERSVILTSYEGTFAGKWGGRVRDTIESNPALFRIRVRQDMSARHMWELEPKCTDGSPAGGGMITAGVAGPVTGQGGDLVIIDDPHKNLKEVRSQVYRDGAWDWYRGTLRDRFEPDAVVICLMQRWHEDDLGGRIIEHAKDGGEEWTIIKLPAIAEEGDPLGREIGEALWPERYPLEALEALKTTLGSYLFAAKFQENPKPAEGVAFKKSDFRYFAQENGYYELGTPNGVKRVLTEDCWRFQTVDPAATEKQENDYFVLQDWVVTPDRDMLLTDQLREHAKTTRHKAIMMAAYERSRPDFQAVENKTFGLNIIQECLEAGLPIKALKADTDKFSRSLPLQARYEAGCIYHRKGAPWLDDFEDELLTFPNGAHDDQVDAAAYAARMLPEMNQEIVLLGDWGDSD